MAVRPACQDDVEAMLDLAERKRAAYAPHALPFHRPARDAREVQRPFFARLLDDPAFIALVHASGRQVDGFLVGKTGRIPPPFGADGFHVDDFAVASPERWPSAGDALLAAAAGAAAAPEMVVVCGPHDAPKAACLRRLGLAAAADWWVKPLASRPGTVDLPPGVRAVLTAAPPVYDPGGPVALVLALDAPARLEEVERWASSSGAAIAVVPARRTDRALAAALPRGGYAVASEWYAGAGVPPSFTPLRAAAGSRSSG